MTEEDLVPMMMLVVRKGLNICIDSLFFENVEMRASQHNRNIPPSNLKIKHQLFHVELSISSFTKPISLKT